MAKAPPGTYVYCLVAADRRPVVRRAFTRLPGMGPVRLIEVAHGQWLVVADAPLPRYGEEAINRRLSDLDWVSRAAVSHEAVVEAFTGQRAVLPMKLFTIFTNDERALDQVRGDARRVGALVKRVAHHQEWGVRVVLDRAKLPPRAAAARRDRRPPGAVYLSQKKAQRDASVELAEHARDTVADLYDRLAQRARLARRRLASELPAQGGPLLLDAAFLVPRARAGSFQALVARQASALARLGYDVSLSGPWPPYTFVKD